MNLGFWSGLITIVLMVAYVGGIVWAWNDKRRPEFDAAAQLPLEDDAEPGR